MQLAHDSLRHPENDFVGIVSTEESFILRNFTYNKKFILSWTLDAPRCAVEDFYEIYTGRYLFGV